MTIRSSFAFILISIAAACTIAAASALAAEPPKLPRAIDIRRVDQIVTCRDMYIAVTVLREATRDASFNAAAKDKALDLYTQALNRLKDLALKEQQNPGQAEEFRREANAEFDKLDREIIPSIGNAGFNELADRCLANFFQVAVGNPISDTLEFGREMGIELTPEQRTRLEVAFKDGQANYEASRGRRPDANADPASGLFWSKDQLRAILAPEQWQKYDKAMMEQVARFKESSLRPPATAPAAR